MIDTGKTLTLAAKTLHDKGAKSVYALITHGKFNSCLFLLWHPLTIAFVGLLSEVNLALVAELPIIQLVVTNTVPQTQHQTLCPKLLTIDISPTIAESIRRTHNGESISLLFGEWSEQGSVPIIGQGLGSPGLEDGHRF
jgi:ribose-phosphate pyrophosphokinase